MAQDEVLEALARDGKMDYTAWPILLDRILPRLDHIVHNEFPIPTIPQSESLPLSILDSPSNPNKSQSPHQHTPSQQSQKENHVPSSLSSPRASASLRDTSSPGPRIPDYQPSSFSTPAGALPPQLLSRYFSIQATLKGPFRNAPPYTIQRLAELILQPSDHYRTLPSYLRAIDRVISVSSSADIFPLSSLASGTEQAETTSYLASGAPSLNHADDFNGAMLTRIPWLHESQEIGSNSERMMLNDLRTESTSLIDGPNGAGSIETVTVSTNGLASASRNSSSLRSEAETVGSSEHPLPGRVTRSSTASARKEEEAAEERVHVRGPDEVGMEDMGPQAIHRATRFDVEAALGRPGEAETLGTPESGEPFEDTDADGDIVVADADTDAKDEDKKVENGVVEEAATTRQR